MNVKYHKLGYCDNGADTCKLNNKYINNHNNSYIFIFEIDMIKYSFILVGNIVGNIVRNIGSSFSLILYMHWIFEQINNESNTY